MSKLSTFDIEQRTAANILTLFSSAESMDDFFNVYNHVYDLYNLSHDPFTGLPVSTKDYVKNKVEFDRQQMFNLYGHSDGLN